MKTVIAIGAAALLAAALPAAAEAGPQARATVQRNAENPALAAILADYEAYLRANDPITAGMEGDKAALSRLPDVSRAHELAQEPELKGFADRLAAIDPASLSDEDRLNHAFLGWIIQRARARIPLDTGRIGAFNSEGGPGQSLAYIASVTRISAREDAEAWIARLEAMPDFYRHQLDDARRGLDSGLVQPRSVVENALSLMEPETAYTPDSDPLLKPFAALPGSISAAEQAALRARAAAVVADRIMPARRDWVRFLREDYLPRAPESLGLVHRPGGRDLYAFLMAGYTTTDLTPDEVHRIGQQEVARIRARMGEEMQAAGWTGDFAAFLAFLRSDPQFYATSREQLLEKASEMAKRADDGLPALFGTLPRLPYGVRPVPAEIEANYTTGRYFSGSMENGVAGGYMVNTARLDQRPLYELPALTLHEAVPGHHLQIALQQESPSAPKLMNTVFFSSYVEGWGLYAEQLADELGAYEDDPLGRIGYLQSLMFRSARLVVDTGIHSKGWSRERGIQYMMEAYGDGEGAATSEVERYCAWPGQACTYKVGHNEWVRLRKKAQDQLGPRFDLRGFHDASLETGGVPLTVLERVVDDWIASRRG